MAPRKFGVPTGRGRRNLNKQARQSSSVNLTPAIVQSPVVNQAVQQTPVRAPYQSDNNSQQNSINFGRSSGQFNGIPLLTSFFDGDQDDCKFFFQQFEDVANLAKWSPEERLTILKSRLRGNALRFLLSDGELTSSRIYQVVKDRLIDFFSEEKGLSERQIQFTNCKQWSNESVKNFAHRLIMASNDYLGDQSVVTPETRAILDRLRLSKFIGALLPELQGDVLRAAPQTFEEAVKIAKNSQTALETMAKMRVNAIYHQRPPINTRDDELASRVEALSLEVNNLRGQEGDDEEVNIFKEKMCLLCGMKNHYTKFCYVYKDLMNARNPNGARRGRGSFRGRGGNQGRSERFGQNNEAQGNQTLSADTAPFLAERGEATS